MATLSAYPTTYLNEDDLVNDVYAFTQLEYIDRALDWANTSTYAILRLAKSTTEELISRISMLTFDFSALPDNAVINDLSIMIRHRVHTNLVCTSIGLQAISGSQTKGDKIDTTVSTSAKYDTVYMSSGHIGTWTAPEVKAIGVNLFATHSTNSSNTYAYIYGVTITVDYTEAPASPVITVLTQDKTKISAITNHDICTVTFSSDQALTTWEARATAPGVTPARGVGLLVESGTLAEGAIGTVIVENEELTNGDLEYTITIYGQNSEGAWSSD